jgi:hypothetical protein
MSGKKKGKEKEKEKKKRCKARNNGCTESHSKHYCKNCKSKDANHRSANCPLPRGCIVTGCPEAHTHHYCKNCKSQNSDHFSQNCHLRVPQEAGCAGVLPLSTIRGVLCVGLIRETRGKNKGKFNPICGKTEGKTVKRTAKAEMLEEAKTHITLSSAEMHLLLGWGRGSVLYVIHEDIDRKKVTKEMRKDNKDHRNASYTETDDFRWFPLGNIMWNWDVDGKGRRTMSRHWKMCDVDGKERKISGFTRDAIMEYHRKY